jgi:type I restriction enzyme S subunit
MGGEWQVAFLTDLYDIASGLSKPAKEFGSGYPFLAFKDVFNNFFLPEDLTQLVQSSEKEQEKCSVKRGDVFLTRTSETMDELGMSSVALKDYENATFNGFTKRLRPKEGNDLVPEYVGYFLRSPSFRREMLAFSTMSTRASLNNEMISRLKISFPSVQEQSVIAHVLKTLDDKIELNRQMNATLESMAQALFKSWFVDFDPGIDNALAAGSPIPDELQARAEVRAALGDKRKPLPEAIQKQFPSNFVFSEEMGWIPEGWEIQPIEKIVGQRNERIDPSKKTRSMPYVPIDCISSRSLFLTESKDGEEAQSSLIRFYEGDILFGAMRPYFHKVCIAPFDGTTRTTAFVLRPQRQEDFSFAVLQLHQERTIEYATAYSTGTTIPYAKWKNSLSRMPIICPPEFVRDAFNEMVIATLQKIPTKYSEVQTLAALRDALLPKLLSGQLRIPDAEKLVADAV